MLAAAVSYFSDSRTSCSGGCGGSTCSGSGGCEGSTEVRGAGAAVTSNGNDVGGVEVKGPSEVTAAGW